MPQQPTTLSCIKLLTYLQFRSPKLSTNNFVYFAFIQSSDYGAGDEIRKSADDVEKESPTHSGEETNYLETDRLVITITHTQENSDRDHTILHRYEKSELISPQDEEGKVEESLLTTTEFDEAGNET